MLLSNINISSKDTVTLLEPWQNMCLYVLYIKMT